FRDRAETFLSCAVGERDSLRENQILRCRCVMRKAIALLACLLYGCTGPLANLNYQPVILNTEDDVQSLKQRLYASSNAKDFAYEVMQITNYRCDQFFESLDRLRSDADFALSRVSALSTGLPQLLQAAHVSGTAMANVAS